MLQESIPSYSNFCLNDQKQRNGAMPGVLTIRSSPSLVWGHLPLLGRVHPFERQKSNLTDLIQVMAGSYVDGQEMTRFVVSGMNSLDLTHLSK